MKIDISLLPEELTVDEEIMSAVQAAAEKAGELYELDDAEVSIVLTDDEHIRELNKNYRNIDSATDVLSFALNESDEPEVFYDENEDEATTLTPHSSLTPLSALRSPLSPNPLGDIIISVEKAAAQAKEYDHSLRREAAFLTVHGFLHLLGYDHIEESDRLEMEEEQRFIMNELQLPRDPATPHSTLHTPNSALSTPHSPNSALRSPLSALDLTPNSSLLTPNLHKSGFVTIIGRPNVGKSTLLNALAGQKVAITSDKPQTTRFSILAVHTDSDAQIVFVDTPGVHKPQTKLGETMAKSIEKSLDDIDAVIFLVDATAKIKNGERYIAERLKKEAVPIILAINKIDLIAPPQILPLIDKYRSLGDFAGIVPLSAKSGENIDTLLAEVKKLLPPGPGYYPPETVTDQSERRIAAEMVRAAVLELTREEVPHAVAVIVEEMKERQTGDVYVRAVVYVERETQKIIIIGKGGAVLKEIGRRARAEIEKLLDSPVYLDLWVKVKKDWRNKMGALKEFGFTEKN